ncbi:DsbA family protein [Lacipirellula limnantheis]|uniref:DSBA-like thioredoxin domain protein n=1 Tax=Lacipirellula limnantheis TaxID=2528024 RepID=A0A517TYG0_9BACT|nr:DsbA family protein [Lacipirellula limnantheis]QDT73406.1 DSBA-like thioredoxin domain protein [Lacipirellula limnantheis]
MTVISTSPQAYRLGSVCLALLATLATSLLVIQNIVGMTLPGCGITSACAQLSAGRWGSLFGWPISYVGLAYFAAVVAALLSSPAGQLPKAVKFTLSLGAAASIGFIVIMFSGGAWCPYCVVVHLSNLGLCTLVWKEPAGDPTAKLRWQGPLATAISVSIALAIAQLVVSNLVRERQLAQTHDSIDQILKNEQRASTTNEAAAAEENQDFTGRWHRGANPAKARLVIFHDYQCKDCAKLDAEVEQMLVDFPELSVSIRHYPMCSTCNDRVSWDFFHKQACRAAYIAEAAEPQGGAEGFWKMHKRLFSTLGILEGEDLRSFCGANGWDYAALEAASQSDAVKQTVADDITEAHSLGATGTPFVFLNGVEIRGASSDPDNVRLAVERLLSEDPTPRPIGWDRRPPAANDRLVAEWQSAKLEIVPPRGTARFIFGRTNSEHRALLFLEPTDRDALPLWHSLLRLMSEEADLQLEVYLFPISRELNPKFAASATDMYPRSTEVTRLIEGIHTLMSTDSQPEVITWCLGISPSLSSGELIDQAASQFHLNRQALALAVSGDRVDAAIAADIQQAQIANVTWAPTLILGNRRAPSATISFDVIKRYLH